MRCCEARCGTVRYGAVADFLTTCGTQFGYVAQSPGYVTRKLMHHNEIRVSLDSLPTVANN